MSRELRLAFAMGGGISLGIFPGAALSEAIKLAVLHGLARSSGTKQALGTEEELRAQKWLASEDVPWGMCLGGTGSLRRA